MPIRRPAAILTIATGVLFASFGLNAFRVASSELVATFQSGADDLVAQSVYARIEGDGAVHGGFLVYAPGTGDGSKGQPIYRSVPGLGPDTHGRAATYSGLPAARSPDRSGRTSQ